MQSRFLSIYNKRFVNICMMVKLYVHKIDSVLNIDMVLMCDYQQHHIICKHLCIFKIVQDWVNILGSVNTMLFVTTSNHL